MTPIDAQRTDEPRTESPVDSLDVLLATIAGGSADRPSEAIPDWAWHASWKTEQLPDGTPTSDELLASKVMIVDDEPINVKLAKKLISELGYSRFVTLTDSREAIESMRRERPDVLLLDLMMPYVSGLDILDQMKADSQLNSIPVIVLTASADRDTRLDALKRGAGDFLAKPVDPAELAPRTRNALLMRSYQNRLSNYATGLEETVRDRTRQLCLSRLELIGCLARAAEYRDDDTGKHVLRVGRYAGVIARRAGMSDEFSEMIELAAQLHDVGKIGIPDSVLLKAGPLTHEETKLMRRHVDIGGDMLKAGLNMNGHDLGHHAEIGAKILQSSQSPLSRMAATIALTHHEKWDGSGYPQGMDGEQIPIEGRMTAIADVFDALRSSRPYKKPFSLERSFGIMIAERGRHFDPALLDHFLAGRHEIEALDAEFADPGRDEAVAAAN